MTVIALPDWLGFLDVNTLFSWFPGPVFLAVACLIVFIETGLLFPILPGDSLLFVTGLLISTGQLAIPLWLAFLALAASAVVGDQVAYFVGHKLGPRVFNRPNSGLLKPRYLDKTSDYFDRYGGRTVIIARFVPLVRTFAAVVAGASRMQYRTFIVYNAIGGTLWAVVVTVAGYFLGRIAFIREHIEFIIVLIVLISVIPIAIEVLRARRASKAAPA